MPTIYKVFISSSAEKSLKSLPSQDQRRIAAVVSSFAIEPLPIGTKKMHGFENTYRVRVGNYRIIYEIRNKEVTVIVLKIGHRKDIYR
jgi:mRNA interferase RelE/StbE